MVILANILDNSKRSLLGIDLILTQKIFTVWLPKSKYQHAGSPEFELYDDRSGDGEHAEVDIYVPAVSS